MRSSLQVISRCTMTTSQQSPVTDLLQVAPCIQVEFLHPLEKGQPGPLRLLENACKTKARCIERRGTGMILRVDLHIGHGKS